MIVLRDGRGGLSVSVGGDVAGAGGGEDLLVPVAPAVVQPQTRQAGHQVQFAGPGEAGHDRVRRAGSCPTSRRWSCRRVPRAGPRPRAWRAGARSPPLTARRRPSINASPRRARSRITGSQPSPLSVPRPSPSTRPEAGSCTGDDAPRAADGERGRGPDVGGPAVPAWRGLAIRPLPQQGTVNALFRPGTQLVARFPLVSGGGGRLARVRTRHRRTAAAVVGQGVRYRRRKSCQASVNALVRPDSGAKRSQPW